MDDIIRMRVRVTDEHIKLGSRKSVRECPVALAITEQLQFGQSVNVGAYYANIWEEGCGLSGRLPTDVAQAIRAFDRGETICPMTFMVVFEDKLGRWERAS